MGPVVTSGCTLDSHGEINPCQCLSATPDKSHETSGAGYQYQDSKLPGDCIGEHWFCIPFGSLTQPLAREWHLDLHPTSGEVRTYSQAFIVGASLRHPKQAHLCLRFAG